MAGVCLRAAGVTAWQGGLSPEGSRAWNPGPFPRAPAGPSAAFTERPLDGAVVPPRGGRAERVSLQPPGWQPWSPPAPGRARPPGARLVGRSPRGCAACSARQLLGASASPLAAPQRMKFAAVFPPWPGSTGNLGHLRALFLKHAPFYLVFVLICLLACTTPLRSSQYCSS